MVWIPLHYRTASFSLTYSFPIYSVWLPLYSFWSMDDFSWGNTRKVVGEGDKKTVVYENDEPFSDNMIPYKSFKGELTCRTPG